MSSLNRVQRDLERVLAERGHTIVLQVLKAHATELTLSSLQVLLLGSLGARLGSVRLDELIRPLPRPSRNRFTQEDIGSRLQCALQRLVTNDKKLFLLDVNERSFTHKLAEYLALEFPGWDVDCEYNRDGSVPKRLVRYLSDPLTVDDTDAQTVFPDIIVHKRGTKKNLLVIEAKKDTNKAGVEWDREKLKAFKHDPDGYKYKFAALVTLKMSIQDADTEWF